MKKKKIIKDFLKWLLNNKPKNRERDDYMETLMRHIPWLKD